MSKDFPIDAIQAAMQKQSNSVDMRAEVFKLVLKHWLSMILCGFVAAGVIWYQETLKPIFYVSETTIIPPISQGDSGAASLGGIEGILLRRFAGKQQQGFISEKILRSRSVRDIVIDTLDLEQELNTSRSGARRWLAGYVGFIIDKEDQSIRIRVTDTDPNRAAFIANGYPVVLEEFNKTLAMKEIKNRREFLSERMGEIRKEMTQSQNMPTFEVEMKQQMYESMNSEYEMVRIQEAWVKPTLQVLDSAEVPKWPLPRDLKKKPMMAGFVAIMAVGLLWYLWDVGIKRSKTHSSGLQAKLHEESHTPQTSISPVVELPKSLEKQHDHSQQSRYPHKTCGTS